MANQILFFILTIFLLQIIQAQFLTGAESLEISQTNKKVRFGVPVDYSFNETLGENENQFKLISVPGCPSSGTNLGGLHHFNRSFWVQLPAASGESRCFLVGTRGPCPVGTKIGADIDSTFGVCKCSCLFTRKYTTPFLQPTETMCHDSVKNKTMIYLNGICHEDLTQGPCEVNQTMVLNVSRTSYSCENFLVFESPEKVDSSVPEESNSKAPRTSTQTSVTVSLARRYLEGIKLCKAHNQKYSSLLGSCVPLN